MGKTVTPIIGVVAAVAIVAFAVPLPAATGLSALVGASLHTGLTNLVFAHRVRGTAPRLKEAQELLKAVRRNVCYG
jgi:hypothetical protein